MVWTWLPEQGQSLATIGVLALEETRGHPALARSEQREDHRGSEARPGRALHKVPRRDLV